MGSTVLRRKVASRELTSVSLLKHDHVTGAGWCRAGLGGVGRGTRCVPTVCSLRATAGKPCRAAGQSVSCAGQQRPAVHGGHGGAAAGGCPPAPAAPAGPPAPATQREPAASGPSGPVQPTTVHSSTGHRRGISSPQQGRPAHQATNERLHDLGERRATQVKGNTRHFCS